MKVTLCIDVNQADHVAAVERWRQAWGSRVQFSPDNQGCGCCVDIWEVEAPDEAIVELPPSVLTSTASPPDRHHRSLREQIVSSAWRARGCLGSLTLLAAGFGLLVLAALQVGIPYQDPTPELQAQYARDLETARTWAVIGITVFACGCFASLVVCGRWAWRRIADRRRLRSRFSSDPTSPKTIAQTGAPTNRR